MKESDGSEGAGVSSRDRSAAEIKQTEKSKVTKSKTAKTEASVKETTAKRKSKELRSKKPIDGSEMRSVTERDASAMDAICGVEGAVCSVDASLKKKKKREGAESNDSKKKTKKRSDKHPSTGTSETLPEEKREKDSEIEISMAVKEKKKREKHVDGLVSDVTRSKEGRLLQDPKSEKTEGVRDLEALVQNPEKDKSVKEPSMKTAVPIKKKKRRSETGQTKSKAEKSNAASEDAIYKANAAALPQQRDSASSKKEDRQETCTEDDGDEGLSKEIQKKKIKKAKKREQTSIGENGNHLQGRLSAEAKDVQIVQSPDVDHQNGRERKETESTSKSKHRKRKEKRKLADCIAMPPESPSGNELTKSKNRGSLPTTKLSSSDATEQLAAATSMRLPPVDAMPADASAEKDLKETPVEEDKVRDDFSNDHKKPSSVGRAFRRVADEEWIGKAGAWDNSYQATFGDSGWGAKAQRVFASVKGKSFRHEKTKKKRGTYFGGKISADVVRSTKFESDDE